MTSLTDKMEGLIRDYDILDDGQFDYRDNVEITVHNKAVAQCIALALAEAAVVGGNGSLESLARELHMWYLEATKQLNPANYNPKAQVPYDDMHEEQKQIDRYIARKITNLLAAKDREVYEYINRGQFSTPENPCEAWEKINLRDKAEIVWHLLKALDK